MFCPGLQMQLSKNWAYVLYLTYCLERTTTSTNCLGITLQKHSINIPDTQSGELNELLEKTRAGDRSEIVVKLSSKP